MSEVLDPEIQAMNFIIQLEPSLRTRVLKWAQERFNGAQAAPSAPAAATTTDNKPRRGRPPKAAKAKRAPKAPKVTKAAKVRKPRAPNEKREANRLLVRDCVKASLIDGKTDRKSVVQFLKDRNADKNLIGNVKSYLKTLEHQKVIQSDGETITLVQG